MTHFTNSYVWLDMKYKDIIATLKAKNGTISVLGSSHLWQLIRGLS
jgi:hypothetical protein